METTSGNIPQSTLWELRVGYFDILRGILYIGVPRVCVQKRNSRSLNYLLRKKAKASRDLTVPVRFAADQSAFFRVSARGSRQRPENHAIDVGIGNDRVFAGGVIRG